MFENVCKHCFRTFRSPERRGYCDACKDLDEVEFDRIEAYLKKYPNSNALQISESLGIEVYDIIKFMSEGRLQVTKGVFTRLED